MKKFNFKLQLVGSAPHFATTFAQISGLGEKSLTEIFVVPVFQSQVVWKLEQTEKPLMNK